MLDPKYSDGKYLEENRTWHAEDAPWKAGHVLAMMRAHGLSPATACEIGCGSGALLHRLGEAMPECRFRGYEPSPQAFELCRRRGAQNVEFAQREFPEEDAPVFDLAFAIDVVEHIDDYRGFLRRVRGKARHVLFHVPLDLSVQTVWRVRPLRKNRDTVGHIHFFTKEMFLWALDDAGYETIACAYTSTAIDLPIKSALSAWARWPRKLLYAACPDTAVRLLGGFSLLVLAR